MSTASSPIVAPGRDYANVVFQSSWPEATGTSDSVVRDQRTGEGSTRWDDSFNNWIIRAAPDGSAGFTNVATSRGRSVGNGGAFDNLVRTRQWAQTAVGQSFKMRMYRTIYVQPAWEDDTHGTYHIDQTTGFWQAPGQIGFHDEHDSGTNVALLLSVIADDPGTDWAYWWLPGGSGNQYDLGLQRGTMYRIEVLYTRTGTNTFTVGYRGYDMAGVELWNENDLDNGWFGTAATGTLAETEFTEVSTAGGSMENRGLQLGINGLTSQAPQDEPLFDYGGILVRQGTGLTFDEPFDSAEEDIEF